MAKVDAEYGDQQISVYAKMSAPAAAGTTEAFKSAVQVAIGAHVEKGPTVTSLKVHAAGAQPRGRVRKLLRKLD